MLWRWSLKGPSNRTNSTIAKIGAVLPAPTTEATLVLTTSTGEATLCDLGQTGTLQTKEAKLNRLGQHSPRFWPLLTCQFFLLFFFICGSHLAMLRVSLTLNAAITLGGCRTIWNTGDLTQVCHMKGQHSIGYTMALAPPHSKCILSLSDGDFTCYWKLCIDHNTIPQHWSTIPQDCRWKEGTVSTWQAGLVRRCSKWYRAPTQDPAQSNWSEGLL